MQERAIRELERLAFSDMGDGFVFDDVGRVYLRQGATITPDARRAIKAVRVRAPAVTRVGRGRDRREVMTEQVEVILHDKLAALDKLFQQLGLYWDPQPLTPCSPPSRPRWPGSTGPPWQGPS